MVFRDEIKTQPISFRLPNVRKNQRRGKRFINCVTIRVRGVTPALNSISMLLISTKKRKSWK
jgi:hypothetical protein